jgi:hypothetical protein
LTHSRAPAGSLLGGSHATGFDAPASRSRRRERLRHPAFNVNNLEQVQAVMTAADEVGAPVILQASAGARKYAGEPSSST